MRGRRPGWGWLAAGFLLATCGPQAEDVPYVRTERAAPDDVSDVAPDDAGADLAGTPLEGWDTTGAGALTGIFALEVIVPVNVVVDVETRQLYRLRLLERGTVLRQKATLCRLALPSIEGLAEIVVPPPLEAVLRDKPVESEGPYLSSADLAGAMYQPEPWTLVVGADLSDPETDPLPSTAEEASALDEDGDGSPGVTLRAEALVCDAQEALFVALRASIALTGAVEGPDRISGSAAPELEQSVLGFSNDCLAAAAGLPIEIREGSTFVATRVGDAEDLDANGNVDCDEIVGAAPALFGDYWAE